jgi:thiol-disulfide isomerase/thioredoxin
MSGGKDDDVATTRRVVNRRLYLIVAVALVAVAVAAVIAARHTNPSQLAGQVDPNHLPVGPTAPAVTAKGWVNSAPLNQAELAGKVVVYDFWTYSCVNCVRTIPYVRAWYERYRADGLVVIGVHSPEFDFEKNHGNVTRAVKELDVTWPVAFDDNMATWNAFQNQYWPADYIADRSSHLRYNHFGEGDYDQTESIIRALLGLPASAPRASRSGTPTGTGSAQPTQADITPETYLGTERGTANGQSGTATYPDPGTPPVSSARLAGTWTSTSQYVQATAAGSGIVLHYQAREVNLVLQPPQSGPVNLRVDLDGKPLPPHYRTAQTMVDDQGHTFVRVTAADLYRIVLGPEAEGHVLRLTALQPGIEAFAFTFGA